MLKVRAILLGLVTIGLIIALCGCGKPEGGGQTGNNGGKKPPVPIPRKDPAEVKRAALNEKRAAVNDTEWDIEVTYVVKGKKKTKTDKLIFVDRRVYIEGFKAEGYPASNYSLRSRSSGEVVVWETMQTNEDGSALFLRGEWRGEKMNGTITRRHKNGKKERITFVSTASRKLEKMAREKEKPEKEG